MLLPAMERAFRRSGRNIAELRCTQTAVAIERFSLAHNRLPVSLSDALPYGLERIPIDPLNGDPLRYKASGTDYCAYSVGPDTRDDGGKPPPTGQTSQLQDMARYDLSFMVNGPDRRR